LSNSNSIKKQQFLNKTVILKQNRIAEIKPGLPEIAAAQNEGRNLILSDFVNLILLI